MKGGWLLCNGGIGIGLDGNDGSCTGFLDEEAKRGAWVECGCTLLCIYCFDYIWRYLDSE